MGKRRRHQHATFHSMILCIIVLCVAEIPYVSVIGIYNLRPIITYRRQATLT